MKWEYKQVYKGYPPMTEVLDAFGREGWELVATLPDGRETSGREYIFKRPRVEALPPPKRYPEPADDHSVDLPALKARYKRACDLLDRAHHVLNSSWPGLLGQIEEFAKEDQARA